MNIQLLTIILPFFAAVLLVLRGEPRFGAVVHALFSFVVFGLTIALWWPGKIEPWAALFASLAAFVVLTAALANISVVSREVKQISGRQWRCYHALLQTMLGLSLLGLYTDNIGLLWLALTAESVAMALGIGLDRTPKATQSARFYIIFNLVGMGLALFGTMLIYLAVIPVLGSSLAAMSFFALSADQTHFNGAMLGLGFIFILFGYGAKLALVPLHGWVDKAYAQGPMSLTCIMPGLAANVALLAILKFRHVVEQQIGSLLPDAVLLAFAIISMLLSALLLARQQDIRKFLGISELFQAGMVIFAFGIGGALAIFAGLLQMSLRTLITSGLFLSVGQIVSTDEAGHHFTHLKAQVQGNQYLLWVFAIFLFMLSGLPPAALFSSEFIIIHQTITQKPWLCLPLLVGIGFYALPVLRRLGHLVFVSKEQTLAKPSKADLNLHLASLHVILVVMLSFAMPEILVHGLIQAAMALQ